jgi:hypothetical protein
LNGQATTFTKICGKSPTRKPVKHTLLIITFMALSTIGHAQNYSNANLNGAYSFQFGDPQAYEWTKTFTCPTNSEITYTVNGSAAGLNVGSGTMTFDGNGNLSVTFTSTGNENQPASANTTSVAWNSSCQVTSTNNGHVVYEAPSTKTQAGTYSIQTNGTGTMSETGSSQSQTVLLAATTNGVSKTVLISNPQINGKSIGTGLAVLQ